MTEEPRGSGDQKKFKVAPNEKRDRAPDEFADEDPKKTKINGLAVNDEEIDEGVDWAVDDNTGKELNPKEVRDARAEELDFMMKLGVFDLVDRDDGDDGGLIDIDKGTAEKPVVRSRLVARDFKGKDGGREDLFAATPPWEILKCVLVLARQTEG